MAKRTKHRKNSKNKPLPPATEKIWIHYDQSLAMMTGITHEPAHVSKDCPFYTLLSSILHTYPEIEKRYPPESRMLAFTLNNVAPEFDTLLKAGDVISFAIVDGPADIVIH